MEKKLWFVFCKSDILLRKTSEGGYEIPYSEQPPTELKPWTTVHNITPMGDIPVQTYRIEVPVTDDANYEMCGLRASYGKISHEQYLKAGKCAEIIYWDINTQYCGVCGAPMKKHGHIEAMHQLWQGGVAATGNGSHSTHSQRRRGAARAC